MSYLIQNTELTNVPNEVVEEFSNFRLFGIGKLSDKQIAGRNEKGIREREAIKMNEAEIGVLDTPTMKPREATLINVDSKIPEMVYRNPTTVSKVKNQNVLHEDDRYSMKVTMKKVKPDEKDSSKISSEIMIIEEKKILGMKKKVAIPVIIVGGLGLVGVGFFLIKKYLIK